MKKITIDIEATGLLDESTVDYEASPWKLKPSFKIHCITVEEHDTGQIICFYDGPTYILDGRLYQESMGERVYTLQDYKPVNYVHKPLSELASYLSTVDLIVAHNGISYDFLVLKVALGIDFTVCPDTLGGRPCVIEDTLVWSKTLNPDRYGGHSLDAWGERVGINKIKFRHEHPKEVRFLDFAADMLYYNIYDVRANTATYRHICVERTGWDWSDAIQTEKQVAEIVSRQEHRGFWFDRDLALSNVKELDELMAERKAKIDPILPPKPITKGEAKEFTPPKRQVKLNLELTSYMEKFLEKHGGKQIEGTAKPSVELFGKTYTLPMPQDSIITEVPASIDDTTHIKGWLVSLGWRPTEYSERDLSTNAKKEKLTKQKYQEAVERYVEQTLSCPFKEQRCDILGVKPEELLSKLLNRKTGRAVKVPTNPKFTVGQEKELCPRLDELEETFPFAKDIVEYLTYRHRRNSILGGGVGWDDDEEEMEKGFLSQVREDGRIPTPADTCGCATSRFKHKKVANIPRVSSLYGHNMRAMFGTSGDYLLMGYDFDSLEARIEAHYCYRYDRTKNKDYCQSLILPKPNDVHCYDEKTEILTEQGWKTFGEISIKDKVAQWEENKKISFVNPSEVVWQDYAGEMVSIENGSLSMLLTPNHRVVTLGKNGRDVNVKLAKEFYNLSSDYSVPCFGVTSFTPEDNIFIRLAVATQADGYLAKDCSAIVFSFVREDKFSRLLGLLDKIDANYTVKECERKGRKERVVRLNASELTKNVRSLLTENKSLLLAECIKYPHVVIDEVKYWDSHIRKNGDILLDITDKQTRDIVSICATLSGRKVSNKEYEKKTSYGETYIYRSYISNNTTHKTFRASRSVSKENYIGKIGCVVVPSGFIVVRRDDKVYVSGNTKTAQAISEVLGKEFGRTPAKSVKYACLPTDNSEVLTRTGWKFHKDLRAGEEVLSYKDGCYEWTPIQNIWHYKDAEVTLMKNKWLSLESTADHRWVGYKRRMKGSGKGAVRYREKGFYTTEEINTETGILHASYYHNTGTNISTADAAVVAWLLSDGYYFWSEAEEVTSSLRGARKGVVGSISQSEHKYWQELEEVLSKTELNYTKDCKRLNNKDFYTYRLGAESLRKFLDRVVGSREQKHEVDWTQWLLTLDQHHLQAFFHHFWLADGHSRNGSKIITQKKGKISDALILLGNLIGKRVTTSEKAGNYLNIHYNDNCFTSGQKIKKSFSRTTDVFCITTKNSTFVTRQNGFVTITGNCSYGAQIAKLAKTIGCDYETAEIVYNTFWEAAAPLKDLMAALEKYWQKTGEKKFILGIDGRKVPTRAKHALVNSLFQSAGVICAKKAMILHEQKLKARGLVVDFWKEDWKNRKFAQQLIAYHK